MPGGLAVPEGGFVVAADSFLDGDSAGETSPPSDGPPSDEGVLLDAVRGPSGEGLEPGDGPAVGDPVAESGAVSEGVGEADACPPDPLLPGFWHAMEPTDWHWPAVCFFSSREKSSGFFSILSSRAISSCI